MRISALALAVFCLVAAPHTVLAEDVKAPAAADAAAEPPAESGSPAQVANKEVSTTKAVMKKAEKRKEKKKEAAKKAPAAPLRADGLQIEDVKAGTGTEAKLGSKITVHYRGTLQKGGKEFDSSYGKEPITFDLLEGRLIKGWTEGIPGMKVGGKRKLGIPYAMAYGDRGTPDGAIPPKSDLNFEVELIEVK